jgi:hypothetical protein
MDRRDFLKSIGAIAGATPRRLIAKLKTFVRKPPVKIVSSCVAGNGSTVFFFIGTDSEPTRPAHPTQIDRSPTLSINGAFVTKGLPQWSSFGHMPWVAYQLSPVATRRDRISWKTSDGWLTTSEGTAGRQSGICDSFAR